MWWSMVIAECGTALNYTCLSEAMYLVRGARTLLHFKFSWKPAPTEPEPVVPDTPGHAIQYYRLQKGIGVRTLVKKLNGSPNRKLIRDYERGSSEPSHETIVKIANIENTYAGVQLRNYMAEQMQKMKRKYGENYEQPTAVPTVSPAFNLPSKYIVHVVGPIVSPHLKQEHKDQLAQCYRSCLGLASERGCKSIAFCCISTGVFMCPADIAAEIAVKTVKEWLDGHPDSCMKKVIFNVFKDSDHVLYERLLFRSL